MLMIPVCGTFREHVSSRIPQNISDLKIESSTVFSFLLACADISDIGTVMPILALSSNPWFRE